MYFDSFSDFLHMGGYGVYVWGSYISSILVLAYFMLSPVFRHRQLRRLQRRHQQRMDRESP